MIVPSLFADLRKRNIVVSVDLDSRLRIEAPQGALDESLRAAIRKYKSELLELAFEIEERAALMFEIDNPSSEDLERTRDEARKHVLGGTASPDGRLWLMEYAERHPAMIALQKIHRRRHGSDAEIVDVRRTEAA